MSVSNDNEISIEEGNTIYRYIENCDTFENKELSNDIFRSLAGFDADISRFIFNICKNKFNCSKDKKWYSFGEHRWKKSDEIYIFVSDVIPKYYQSFIEDVDDFKIEMEEEEKDIIRNAIRKIIKKLKNRRQMTDIFNDVALRFILDNENFYENLDKNTNLIGFNNGIYDLEKMEFRNGKAEDMVSMSCGYDFSNNFSEHINELEQFINDILPNEKDKDEFLTHLSLGFFGVNKRKYFTLISGNGSNGKSTMMDLISRCMGDYFDFSNENILTGKMSGEILLTLEKKRIILVQEQENNEIDYAFVSYLTGNDKKVFRRYGKGLIEFKPNFSTFYVCNKKPSLNTRQLEKRIRCFEFPTNFVEEPNKQNHKKVNINIIDNFDNWRNDFMLILLKYYSKYVNNE